MLRRLAERWADNRVIAQREIVRRELIKAWAAVARLTQERDKARFDCKRANTELAAEQQRHHNTQASHRIILDGKDDGRLSRINTLEEQAERDRHTIETTEEELRRANGKVGHLKAVVDRLNRELADLKAGQS